MDPVALICAVAGGLLSSLSPAVTQWQGPGLNRQVSLHSLTALVAGAACTVYVIATGSAIGGLVFLAIAAASGLAAAINNPVYFAFVVHRGPVAISWAVVWMSAVVAAVLGWIVMGEEIYLAQVLGLACFISSLLVMGLATWRHNRRAGKSQPIRRGYWPLLILATCCGGLAGFLMKFKDIAPAAGQGAHLSFLLPRYMLVAVVMGLIGRQQKVRPTGDRRTWLLAAALAVLVLGPQWLILIGLGRANVSQVLPVMAGVTIAAGVMLARVRGERTSRLSWIGAGLAIASVVLMNV